MRVGEGEMIHKGAEAGMGWEGNGREGRREKRREKEMKNVEGKEKKRTNRMKIARSF